LAFLQTLGICRFFPTSTFELRTPYIADSEGIGVLSGGTGAYIALLRAKTQRFVTSPYPWLTEFQPPEINRGTPNVLALCMVYANRVNTDLVRLNPATATNLSIAPSRARHAAMTTGRVGG
jgi:hypothetical protein